MYKRPAHQTLLKSQNQNVGRPITSLDQLGKYQRLKNCPKETHFCFLDHFPLHSRSSHCRFLLSPQLQKSLSADCCRYRWPGDRLLFTHRHYPFQQVLICLHHSSSSWILKTQDRVVCSIPSHAQIQSGSFFHNCSHDHFGLGYHPR